MSRHYNLHLLRINKDWLYGAMV